MLVRIHHEGRAFVIEAPDGTRVVRTSEDDCLVYRCQGRQEFLLTPFTILLARDGAKGHRLISEGQADLPTNEEGPG